MKSCSKKIISVTLVILLIVQPILFLRPKKSEAIIPVIDAANLAVNTLISASSATTAAMVTGQLNAYTQKEFNLDSIAWFVAKIAVRQVTEQIVNWINSGFQGSPAFITNPANFLVDIADITVGELIRASAEWLCHPYQFNVQLALQFHFKGEGTGNDWCRFSDIFQNAGDAISNPNVNVNISAKTKFGMKNWFNMSQNQKRTTELGAFVETKNAITIRTYDNQEIELLKLNWGKGFLSWEQCERLSGPETADGQAPQDCKIVTPGTVIESQLIKIVGNDIEQLNLADEFNEILGALANQLLLMAMGSTKGLLGADREFTYSLRNDRPNMVPPLSPNDFTDGVPPIDPSALEDFYLSGGLQPIDLSNKLTIMSGSYNDEVIYEITPETNSRWSINYILPGNNDSRAAIDNNTMTQVVSNSGLEPWIFIDLGADIPIEQGNGNFTIKKIEIEFYEDGSGDMVSDFYVFVSPGVNAGLQGVVQGQRFMYNTLVQTISVSSIEDTINNTTAQTIHSSRGIRNGDIWSVPTNIIGRFVRIQRETPTGQQNNLKVKEIRLYQEGGGDIISRDQSPIITLSGNGVQSIGVNSYLITVDSGSNPIIEVEAKDSEGKDISNRVRRDRPINTQADRRISQRITYSVTDDKGKTAQAILTVVLRENLNP